MPKTDRPMSHAVRYGELVFVSGQASVSEEGRIVTGSFQEEMELAMKNLDAVLQAAGTSRRSVIQTRNYVDRQADMDEFNVLYKSYFAPPYPARTTIMNCLGGVLRYEIDVVAIVEK